MKIVVFGDVHGNLPALELMVDVAGNVDQYVCLGDVVNYGPWSNECVQFISELENCIKIRGNHEDSIKFAKTLERYKKYGVNFTIKK